MANMGYCRFQNTLADLRDCNNHIFDSLSEDEAKARDRLIELCREIVDDTTDIDFEDAGDLDDEGD